MYRIGAESRTTVKTSDKRFIAIDRALAAAAEAQHEGGTLRQLVEHLLQSYVSEGAVMHTNRREELEQLA